MGAVMGARDGVADDPQQGGCGGLAHAAQGLMNGGERRVVGGGGQHIVKADHRNVLGNAQRRLAQGENGSNSGQVVESEDSGEGPPGLEQLLGDLKSKAGARLKALRLHFIRKRSEVGPAQTQIQGQVLPQLPVILVKDAQDVLAIVVAEAAGRASGRLETAILDGGRIVHEIPQIQEGETGRSQRVVQIAEPRHIETGLHRVRAQHLTAKPEKVCPIQLFLKVAAPWGRGDLSAVASGFSISALL